MTITRSIPQSNTRQKRSFKFNATELWRWMLPITLLVVWQISSNAGWLSAQILPAPTAVFGALEELIRNGKLWEHFAISIQRALLGVFLGFATGFTLGLLVGINRFLSVLLDSTLQMVRNIPHLALVPLVIMWFGIGETGKIFLIALGTFFPIYLNTVHGIRGIDPKLLEMARVYGLTGQQTFWRVILPGALPGILVGLRYSLGIAWLSLVVSESIAANAGIGHLAMDAREFMRTDIVVLVILIYAALGKWADSTVRILERRLLPWHPNLK
ncbi:ABC transporter permease subunit [Deinococcus roseus]|uniref:ABC transporter permease n=1 Tax=Deinococcus roseus TaxID=392414 RepID=A0ABQ2D0T7_9DEIO|nr:ABC transporter permease subunit [Deinococcus roseus]GGJ28647.1 ABC transporter permease [Deinococcus roseus]